MNIRLLPAIAAAILLTAATTTLAITISLPDELIQLQGVSAASLASSGLILTIPAEREQATIPKPTATNIRETVLARLRKGSAVPPVDRLVWIVSYQLSRQPTHGCNLDRETTPAADECIINVWTLHFVDATTGALVDAIQGTAAPQ